MGISNMKPDEQTIKDLIPILQHNIHLAVEDFENIYKQQIADQNTVNIMFSAFVIGMYNIMNPKSAFNTKYSFQPSEDKSAK